MSYPSQPNSIPSLLLALSLLIITATLTTGCKNQTPIYYSTQDLILALLPDETDRATIIKLDFLPSGIGQKNRDKIKSRVADELTRHFHTNHISPFSLQSLSILSNPDTPDTILITGRMPRTDELHAEWQARGLIPSSYQDHTIWDHHQGRIAILDNIGIASADPTNVNRMLSTFITIREIPPEKLPYPSSSMQKLIQNKRDQYFIVAAVGDDLTQYCQESLPHCHGYTLGFQNLIPELNQTDIQARLIFSDYAGPENAMDQYDKVTAVLSHLLFHHEERDLITLFREPLGIFGLLAIISSNGTIDADIALMEPSNFYGTVTPFSQ